MSNKPVPNWKFVLLNKDNKEISQFMENVFSFEMCLLAVQCCGRDQYVGSYGVIFKSCDM